MNLRRNRTTLLVMQAVAGMVLAGCGGADEPTAASALSEPSLEGAELEQAERLRWRSFDSVPPTVTVGGVGEVSASGLVGLGGTAGDNLWLYRVRWSNDRGGSGTAKLSGTVRSATWTVASLQLQQGDNTITIRSEERL